MKRNLLSLFFVLIFFAELFGQGETYNWCFGDSNYIKYTGGIMIPQAFSSAQSGEMGASISDKNGNLLFYLGGISQDSYRLRVYDRNHQMMPAGDSLLGYASSTNGVIIVPFPNDSNKFYIFSSWYPPSTHNNFLYANIIDMSLNSGNGDLILKDSLILNQPLTEKMALVKHGNGRDWWLLTHAFGGNSFFIFLIDSSGISSPFIQSIGTNYSSSIPYYGASGEMVFSNNGDKLVAVGATIIDYFQFDRCTGILSSFQDLAPNSTSAGDAFYGCSFSPNDSVLYVSDWASTNVTIPPLSGDLYQFDLTAANIVTSRQTIFSFINSNVAFGQHQLAPDEKIYINTNYRSFPNYTFDSTTMYLSTIDNPNTLGLGCNFQLHSFYLGGHRSLAGLPNMPNYNLGTLGGSPCDTITGIKFNENAITKIEIYPNPFSDKINITPETNEPVEVTLFDVTSRKIFYQSFTKSTSINTSQLAKGIYLYEVRDKNGVINKGKIMKE